MMFSSQGGSDRTCVLNVLQMVPVCLRALTMGGRPSRISREGRLQEADVVLKVFTRLEQRYALEWRWLKMVEATLQEEYWYDGEDLEEITVDLFPLRPAVWHWLVSAQVLFLTRGQAVQQGVMSVADVGRGRGW